MLRLRPYKSCDAKAIKSWLSDKKTFLLWGGEHFGEYPVTEEMINKKYFSDNGGCIEEDNFYPITAFDESGIVGHFIIRYLNGNNKLMRFGWVIVDDKKRGQKLGQQMLTLGLSYAFDILKAETVTIGVYEDNIPACCCYSSIGFHSSENIPDHYEETEGQKRKVCELEIKRSEFCKSREKQ